MKFRKKPVVVEAVCNEALAAAPIWLQAATNARTVRPLPDGSIAIDTLEGTMIAAPGDWIILGIKGEIYPCKPDIFDATYEAVPEPYPYPEHTVPVGMLTAADR